MWAWLASIGIPKDVDRVNRLTLQSLPRELSLPEDGILRNQTAARTGRTSCGTAGSQGFNISEITKEVLPDKSPIGTKIATLPGDSVEIRVTVAREQAERKLFGFTLFSDGKGAGLPIFFRPETGTIPVGTTEAPFKVSDLPAGEEHQSPAI